MSLPWHGDHFIPLLYFAAYGSLSMTSYTLGVPQ